MSRYSYINQRASKVNCLYDMFRARTFHARRKSLRACYAHAYECPSNFLRPAFVLCHGTLNNDWCRIATGARLV